MEQNNRIRWGRNDSLKDLFQRDNFSPNYTILANGFEPDFL